MSSPSKTNKVAGDASNIHVCARFRPLSDLELKEDSRTCVRLDGRKIEIASAIEGDESSTNHFHFPTVYGTKVEQESIFQDIGMPVLKDVFSGYNGTIFVYGQTGSGKTYTMLGPHGVAEQLLDRTADIQRYVGLMPRLINALFDEIERAPEEMEFGISVTYVEIYKEKVRDLLNKNKDKVNLHLREDPATFSFYVEGASKRYVTAPTEILEIIAEGNINRAVAATRVNEHSSRSHSVLQLELKSIDASKGETRVGKLFLVDLAGSEKVSKTGAEGLIFEEARQINLSLTTLGLVIKELSEGQRTHISYRNSMLTKLLQDSLGGNSKTSLIVCCSPSVYNGEETLSSLRFGARAANIKNRPVVNKELSPEQLKALLAKAEEEIEQLRLGRGQAAPSFTELEWEARLDRLEQRHKIQISAMEEDMAELQARAQELNEINGLKTAHMSSLKAEIQQWEQEWLYSQKELNANRSYCSRIKDEIDSKAQQMTQNKSEIGAAKTRVEACLATLEDTLAAARTTAEDTTTERDRASAQHQQLEMECMVLRAELQELHNDNGGLAMELQLAERKLTIRNERIENLKVGMNQQMQHVTELERKRAKELWDAVHEAQTCRTDADYWRTQYERLRAAAAEVTTASPPGTRANRTLRGGSHSPESTLRGNIENVLDL